MDGKEVRQSLENFRLFSPRAPRVHNKQIASETTSIRAFTSSKNGREIEV